MSRPLTDKTLFLCRLLIANESGDLSQFARAEHISLTFAEGQVRRFNLSTARSKRRVKAHLDNWEEIRQGIEARRGTFPERLGAFGVSEPHTGLMNRP